jgi:hypothetical protein
MVVFDVDFDMAGVIIDYICLFFTLLVFKMLLLSTLLITLLLSDDVDANNEFTESFRIFMILNELFLLFESLVLIVTND